MAGSKRDLFFAALSATCLLASSALLLLSHFVPPSDSVCLARSSAFSPLLGAVRYEYVNFGDHYHHSRFRGASTPLLEQTWSEFLAAHLVKFPVDRVDNLQVEAPADTKWKKYNIEYLAAVPAFVQQLNCLNLLRKYAHEDLETLVCKGDVTPFLVWKNPEHLTEGPDLDIRHKCRNIDDLRNEMEAQTAGNSRLYKMADF